MVVANMPRLSGSTKSTNHQHTLHFFFHDKPHPPTLGILAFDTAKIMATLISLHRSLADAEVRKLRNETIKSQGVVYLNSRDENFLLNLALAERLEELNNAANSVSRLSRKCSDLGLNRFDLVFSDMKLGIFHAGKVEFGCRNIPKLIGRMEKLVSATAELHSAMEALVEMEASEKKLQKWKSYNLKQCPPVNFEMFEKKIVKQRKDMKHYKEISLWNQTFDYAVGLMTRLICVIYARLCSVFGPCIPDQTCPFDRNPETRLLREPAWSWNIYGVHRKFGDNSEKLVSKSGPIPKSVKMELVRFPSGERIQDDILVGTGECSTAGEAGNNRVYSLAPPTTVGGAGLSIHYANVILFAERCLHAPVKIAGEARGELYEMLPARIKAMLRTKLRRNNWERKDDEETAGDGHSLAEGWREALEEMMGWLAPLAHDTVRWQSERNLEKKRFNQHPTVVLMQTLHYSDLEKAEAAIVEVLVGLSCIYRYEHRRPSSRRSYDHMLV